MGKERLTLVVALLAGSFLIRCGAVASLRNWSDPPNRRTTGADGVEYNTLALQLARGHGYTWENQAPTSFRAPGFPLFLGAVYRLCGPCYPVVYLILCLLGALPCVLAYLLAGELTSESNAKWAGILAAVYVPGVYFATRFDSENLFIPLLALGLWLLIRHLRTDSVGLLCLSGLFLGLAAFTRPFTVLLLPILGTVLIVQQVRRRRVQLGPACLFGATFIAVLVPWTVRNYRVHDRFVLVAIKGGSTFYGGNNDRVLNERPHLGGWLSPAELPARDAVEGTPNEVAHDDMEWRLDLAWCREHLASLPPLCACKFARFWLPDVDSPKMSYVWAQLAGYTPFLVLFVVGLVACARRREYRTASWMAIHGTLGASVLTALVFWGNPRFRDANAPLLMVYAAVGLATVFGWIPSRARRPARLGEPKCQIA